MIIVGAIVGGVIIGTIVGIAVMAGLSAIAYDKGYNDGIVDLYGEKY
ncbi:hypothetical protein WKH57_15290 [Niallia taxi]